MGRTACIEPQFLYKGALYRTACTQPQFLYKGALYRTACIEPQFLYKGALYRTACTEPQCLYKGALYRTACTQPQCLYNGALYLYLLPSCLRTVLPDVQYDAAASVCDFRHCSVPNGAEEHSAVETVERHVRFVRAYGGQVGAFTGCRIGIDQRCRKGVTFALGRSRKRNTTDLEGRTQDDVAEQSETSCRTLHTFFFSECHP
jgi:hypothetical protein